MRMRGLVILVLALPLSVRAQTDAPADPPAISEEGGPAAPREGAAPAAPPPEVASPPAAEAAPEAPVAPAQAPSDAQPPAEATRAAEPPAAPAVSPSAPAGFTPSSSPLLAPSSTAPAPLPPPPTTYPPLPPPGAAAGYAPAGAPWWAPPPNYALVPLPPGGAIMTLSPQERARREEVYKRLQRVDLRLYQLRQERASIGGPVTMMVLGYGAALIAGSRAIAASHAAKQDRSLYRYNDDYDYNDGYVDHDDAHALRRTARALTGVAAGGLALGLIGTVVLVRRLPRRRAIKQERRSLLAERNSLRQQLYYGTGFSANTFQLSLRGRF